MIGFLIITLCIFLVNGESDCKNWDVRLESSTPSIFWNGAWRPICGHWFWDNNFGASTFCKKLGFVNGGTVEGRGELRTYPVDAFSVGGCRQGEVLESCSAGGNVHKIGNDGLLMCGAGEGVKISILCDGNYKPQMQSCGKSVCRNWDVRLDWLTPSIFWNGAWRPICGHWFWDNNFGASDFCKKLGFANGGRVEGRGKRRGYTVDSFSVGGCKQGEVLEHCSAGGNFHKIGNDGSKCGAGEEVKVSIYCVGNFNARVQSCGTPTTSITTARPTTSTSVCCITHGELAENRYCNIYVHRYPHYCSPRNDWFVGCSGRYRCGHTCGYCG